MKTNVKITKNKISVKTENTYDIPEEIAERYDIIPRGSGWLPSNKVRYIFIDEFGELDTRKYDCLATPTGADDTLYFELIPKKKITKVDFEQIQIDVGEFANIIDIYDNTIIVESPTNPGGHFKLCELDDTVKLVYEVEQVHHASYEEVLHRVMADKTLNRKLQEIIKQNTKHTYESIV